MQDYNYDPHWSKWVIGFIPMICTFFIFSISMAFLYICIFYVIVSISWVSSSVIDGKIRYKRSIYRKLRNYNEIITSTGVKLPDHYKKLDVWLKKEGFLLKVRSTAIPYFESKTVLVEFYPSMKDRISIRGTKSDKDYLVYNEDEELKFRIGDYLGYLYKEYDKYQISNKSFINLNKTMGLSNDFLFNQKFAYFLCRGQGYLFLIIYITNFRPTEDSTNNFIMNFGLSFFYLIIENLIQ